MADSLLVKKDFLAVLKQEICCFESDGRYCRSNTFCTSVSQNWPSAGNAREVRLSHLSKDSLPETADFCSSYMDWHERFQTPSKGMSKPILKFYSSHPGQMVRQETTLSPEKKARSVSGGREGEGRFREDTSKLTDFCRGIQPVSARKDDSPPQTPEPKDIKKRTSDLLDKLNPGTFDPKDWNAEDILTLIVAIGATLGVAYLIAKLIKAFRRDKSQKPEDGSFARDEGRAASQDAADRKRPEVGGRRAVAGEFVAPKVATPRIEPQAANAQNAEGSEVIPLVHKKVGVPNGNPPIPQAAEAQKVEPPRVATPGGETPEDRSPSRGFFRLPTLVPERQGGFIDRSGNDAKTNEPPVKPPVVQVQNGKPQKAESLFTAVSKVETPQKAEPQRAAAPRVEPPPADLSDQTWPDEFDPPSNRATAPATPKAIVNGHSGPVAAQPVDAKIGSVGEGTSAEIRSKRKSDQAAEAAAFAQTVIAPWQAVSADHLEVKIGKVPHLEKGVLGQLRSVSKDLRNQPWFVQLYMTQVAIDQSNARYSTGPSPQKLSLEFIKEFAEKNLEAKQLEAHKPAASDWILKKIQGAWVRLPQSVQKEFGPGWMSGVPPHLVLAFMTLPEKLPINPFRIMERVDKPWELKPHEQQLYEGFNLSNVMASLARENPELAFYPGLLELNSIYIIKSWKTLDEEQRMKMQFGDTSDHAPSARVGGMKKVAHLKSEIPHRYVKKWHDSLMHQADEVERGGADFEEIMRDPAAAILRQGEGFLVELTRVAKTLLGGKRTRVAGHPLDEILIKVLKRPDVKKVFFGRASETIISLRKKWADLTKEPLYFQLGIESAALKEWSMRSSVSPDSKPSEEFIRDFVERNRQPLSKEDRNSMHALARLKLTKKWLELPVSVRREFGFAHRNPPPVLFVTLTRVPSDDSMLSLKSLDRAKEPWRPDPAKEALYEGIFLNNVMEILAEENKELRFYPQILEMEAMHVVDSWKSLSEEEQSFWEPRGTIPASFVKAWHARLVSHDDGPKGNGGSGPANGGVISGFKPSGETSGPPDTGSAAAQMINGDNGLSSMGIEYFYGMPMPLQPSPQILTPWILPPLPVGISR